jgi:hypothetical protein
MNEWVWSISGLTLTGENWSAWCEICHIATLSSTNPIWTGLGLNLGLHVDRRTTWGVSWPAGMYLAFHIASALYFTDLDWVL